MNLPGKGQLLLALLLFVCSTATAQAPPLVFPQPQSMNLLQQRFTLQHPYTVVGNINAGNLALLNEVVKSGTQANNRTVDIKVMKDPAPPLHQSGAYRLDLLPEKITISVVDQRSVFYALQTLRQLAQKNNKGQTSLPVGEVVDFPDVAYRGTVEGFYGEPWSHQDRLEQLRFYGRFKLNTYIYGPKDDPYHSSPHWRDPYPAEKAAQIKELITEAKQNSVDFVWAIHPGKDIKWNREDSGAVLRKFEYMYALGVRSFAVFFDDISGAGTDALKQAGLLNFLQHQFVDKKRDVTPLVMCPTEYNKAWSNKKEGTYLDILGEHLHPAIHIMWTGNSVVADITTEGLSWVNRRIRRPAFVWWNFPVSDYVRDHLLMGPAYGLDTTAAPHLSGFVSNPMDKAEASKLAIFSVALYAWNMKSYDPQKAWLAAIGELVPEAPDAFALFAAHNSDPGPNGHRYRREESVVIKPVVDSFWSIYNNKGFSKERALEIKSAFTRMLPVVEEIRSKSNNKRLVEQLSPWLAQYELLAKSGVHALLTAQQWNDNNPALAWKHFLHTAALLDSMNLIDTTFNQNPYQPGVKTGSLVLMPLVKKLHEQAARAFVRGGQTAGTANNNNVVPQSAVYSNAEKLRYQPLQSSNRQIALSPLLEVLSLAPGEYVGLQLHSHLKPVALHLNLENNNLQAWGRFEASADGQRWKAFSVLEKRGKGSYPGLDEQVRYVRFRNTSDKPQMIYVREMRLEVEPASRTDKSVFSVDGSVATWLAFSKEERLDIPLPAGLQNQALTLLVKSSGAPYTITGINKKGRKTVLYKGNADFVQLSKAKNKNLSSLQLAATSEQPLLLYEVMKRVK